MARPLPHVTRRYGRVPSEVKLWQATNENARDFRLESVGKVWKSSPVTGSGGAYEATSQ